jgi:hypothetical protein
MQRTVAFSSLHKILRDILTEHEEMGFKLYWFLNCELILYRLLNIIDTNFDCLFCERVNYNII